MPRQDSTLRTTRSYAAPEFRLSVGVSICYKYSIDFRAPFRNSTAFRDFEAQMPRGASPCS